MQPRNSGYRRLGDGRPPVGPLQTTLAAWSLHTPRIKAPRICLAAPLSTIFALTYLTGRWPGYRPGLPGRRSPRCTCSRTTHGSYWPRHWASVVHRHGEDDGIVLVGVPGLVAGGYWDETRQTTQDAATPATVACARTMRADLAL